MINYLFLLPIYYCIILIMFSTVDINLMATGQACSFAVYQQGTDDLLLLSFQVLAYFH